MLRRAFAATVAGAVLTIQLWRLFPVGADSMWYWPFMDYPMYSEPHRYGEELVERELRGVPCDGGRLVALPPDSLRAPAFFVWSLLANAAGASAYAAQHPAVVDSSRRAAVELVRRRGDGRYCRVQLWARHYRFGRSGLRSRRPQYVLLHDWPLTEPAAPSPTRAAR